MTAIHSFRPRAQANDNTTTSQIYFIIAAVLVISFIGLRITTLRRRNQALSEFFRFNGANGTQPPNDTSYGSSYRPYGVQLAPLPTAYHRDRRVRSADTDAQGRRLGPAGEDGDGKDTLPAYDNVDRPPKYVEASWSQAPPHQATDQFAGAPAGEQSGVGILHGYSTISEDQPHENVDTPAQLPPVHHDSSRS